MKKLITFSAAVALTTLAVTATADEGDQAQMIAIDGKQWHVLFNGENLDGWRASEENPDSFAVQDERIVVDGPRGHLFYDGPVAGADFDDFHFRAEVFTYPNANSGIFYHTRWQPGGWPGAGYEAQVNASHGDRIKTGSVYSVANVMDDAPHDDQEWFLYEIIVEGEQITHKIDGETVIEYTEDPDDIQGDRRLSSGTFALQAHDPDSRIYFRNIYVRPVDGGEFDLVERPAPADEGLVNIIPEDADVTPLPSDNTPDGEGVANALDGNAGTKYLNFDGHEQPSGLEVIIDEPAVVQALRLTSANDAPQRDPASFRLEGANEDGDWTEIASGPVDPFRSRHAVQLIELDNDQPYTRYRILFPEVRDANAANSMQIARVELLAEED